MKRVLLSIAGGVGFVILAVLCTLILGEFAVFADSKVLFRAAQVFNSFVLGWSLWVINLFFDVRSPADGKPTFLAIILSLIVDAVAYTSLVYVMLWRRARYNRLS